jgi:hypothetical protein
MGSPVCDWRDVGRMSHDRGLPTVLQSMECGTSVFGYGYCAAVHCIEVQGGRYKYWQSRNAHKFAHNFAHQSTCPWFVNSKMSTENIAVALRLWSSQNPLEQYIHLTPPPRTSMYNTTYGRLRENYIISHNPPSCVEALCDPNNSLDADTTEFDHRASRSSAPRRGKVHTFLTSKSRRPTFVNVSVSPSLNALA